MVRSRIPAAFALLASLGLTALVEAQTTSRHRPRPRPTPPPAPQPAPKPGGSNDAGGDSNVRPGSIAPRSNMGIGIRDNFSRFEPVNPVPIYQPPDVIIQPWPLPRHNRHDRDDRARWWYYKRERDRRDSHYPRYIYPDRHYPAYPIVHPSVLTYGTSLSLSGYGLAGQLAYPATTVGIMSLPAPAVVYDPATGAYIYSYGNPNGPGLLPADRIAAPPAAMPRETPTATPPRAPTVIELAQDDIRFGQPDRALTDLREHLKKNPDDAKAQRVMAVALLERNRFDDAVASIRQAYRTDPRLADEPIRAAEFGYNDEELRAVVVRAVTYANRVDTGSAWLTVATLMQAEGRTEQARNALEKARKQGLEAEILGSMKAALKV